MQGPELLWPCIKPAGAFGVGPSHRTPTMASSDTLKLFKCLPIPPGSHKDLYEVQALRMAVIHNGGSEDGQVNDEDIDHTQSSFGPITRCYITLERSSRAPLLLNLSFVTLPKWSVHAIRLAVPTTR